MVSFGIVRRLKERHCSRMNESMDDVTPLRSDRTGGTAGIGLLSHQAGGSCLVLYRVQRKDSEYLHLQDMDLVAESE